MRPLLPVLALSVALAGPAFGRVECGDTLSNEAPRPDGAVVLDLSKGRLAAEMAVERAVADDKPLMALVRQRTEALREREVKQAGARPREDKRTCWSRFVAARFANARLISVVMNDRMEIEAIGRSTLSADAVLWDRKARRALKADDLLILSGDARKALVSAARDDLREQKRERDGREMDPSEASGFLPDDAPDAFRAVSLKAADDGADVAGIVLHFDAGRLGARMEGDFELLVPSSTLRPHLKPDWRDLFAKP